jgi:hypothetical protein
VKERFSRITTINLSILREGAFLLNYIYIYIFLFVLSLFIWGSKELQEDLIPVQYLDDCEHSNGRLSWKDGDEYCANSITANADSLILEINGSNLNGPKLKIELNNRTVGTYTITDTNNIVNYTSLLGSTFKSDKDNRGTLTINSANEAYNKIKGTAEVTVYDPAGIVGQKNLFASFDVSYSE